MGTVCVYGVCELVCVYGVCAHMCVWCMCTCVYGIRALLVYVYGVCVLVCLYGVCALCVYIVYVHLHVYMGYVHLCVYGVCALACVNGVCAHVCVQAYTQGPEEDTKCFSLTVFAFLPYNLASSFGPGARSVAI